MQSSPLLSFDCRLGNPQLPEEWAFAGQCSMYYCTSRQPALRTLAAIAPCIVVQGSRRLTAGTRTPLGSTFIGTEQLRICCTHKVGTFVALWQPSLGYAQLLRQSHSQESIAPTIGASAAFRSPRATASPLACRLYHQLSLRRRQWLSSQPLSHLRPARRNGRLQLYRPSSTPKDIRASSV